MIKMLRSFGLMILLCCSLVNTAQAQINFTWNFENPSPQQGVSSNTAIAGAGLAAAGAGVGTVSFTAAGNGGGQAFTANLWSTAALVADDYIEFSITTLSCRTVTLTTLNLDALREHKSPANYGPATLELRSSLNSYGTSLGSITTATTDLWTSHVLNGLNIVIPGSTTVTLRLYGYNAGNANRFLTLDNVSFSGTFTNTAPSASPSPAMSSTCIGSAVMVNGTPSGGTGVYTSHVWTILDAGATGAVNANLTNANTPIVIFQSAGLMAGTVTLLYAVTDNAGCTGTQTATVVLNTSPVAVITGNLGYCAGGNTTLTAGGGVSYAWSNGALTSMTTVTSGVYTVIVTDANGCTDSETAMVTANPLPTATISGSLTYCAGGNTTLTASGGVSYVWSNGALTSMTTVTAGVYTVVATDANGCTDAETVTVTANPLPTATISGSLTYCAGDNTTLTAGGGVSYAWSNGALTAMTTVTAGTYTVVVTAANGCTDSETASVTANPLPTATISGNLSYCAGSNTTLTAGGGVSYAWSNGALTSMTTVTAGVYTVVVTDMNGCTDSETATVTANPLPTATISGNLGYCPGGNTTLTAGGGISYAWSNGALTAMTTVTAGLYTVIVTDMNGCTDSETAIVTVNPVPTAVISGSLSYCMGSNTTLTASGGITFSWSNGVMLAMTTVTAGTYTVVVTDVNGCTDAESVTVTEKPLPVVSAGTYTTVCMNAPDVALSGSPAGGTFTGMGVTGNLFDPSVGTQMITYTYSEMGGCSNSATTTINVIVCTSFVNGRIIWEGDRLTTMTGVNQTTVRLSGDEINMDLTPLSGNYSLSYATGNNFMVTPVKNRPMPFAINGLSAADASRIQQHINGSLALGDPYKLIAADANKSNSITTADVYLIQQAVIGNPTAQSWFAGNTWRFVPKAYVFPSEINPWGFPEKITLTGISGTVGGQDFIGIKLGDVNRTVNPANGPGSAMIWTLENQTLEKDALVTAEFSADNFEAVLALQFALQFDTEMLAFQGLETIAGSPLQADNFGLYDLSAGEIRVFLASGYTLDLPQGAPGFRVTFKVLQNGAALSDALQLNHAVLTGEVYGSDYVARPVTLVYNSATTGIIEPAANRLGLWQNHPNPFRERTAIGFVLPEDGVAQIRIMDVNGRLIQEQKGWYTSGYNEVLFRLDNYAGEGVLYYELVTPAGILSKKMLLLR